MNNNNKVIIAAVALLVGLGLVFTFTHHGATNTSTIKQPILGGVYETNPSHFANGLYAGQTDQLSVDGSGNIIQTSGTALFSNLVQNAGIVTYTTSTNVSTLQFCAGGMFVIPSTNTVAVTLTLPALSQIASSVCASSIYSGSFNQNMIVNLSSFPVTIAASGTGESILGPNGTSAVLPSGHSGLALGGFVNTAVRPGATFAGTTFQVLLTDYQSLANTNANTSSTTPFALGSAWMGHIVVPTTGNTVAASTTAVSSANTVIDLIPELTSPIPGVTCTATLATGTAVTVLYNASSTLSGFKVTANAAPVTNPYCYAFNITN